MLTISSLCLAAALAALAAAAAAAVWHRIQTAVRTEGWIDREGEEREGTVLCLQRNIFPSCSNVHKHTY